MSPLPLSENQHGRKANVQNKQTKKRTLEKVAGPKHGFLHKTKIH